MSWAEKSRRWFRQQEAENPEMSLDELKKHCTKNYPYFERKGWAYKAWLKARKEFFSGASPVRGRMPSPQSVNENQDDMFGGGA